MKRLTKLATAFILLLTLCFEMELTAHADAYSPTPDIIIESTRIYDSSGRELFEVTEDTPSFTLEISYTDFGLIETANSDLLESSRHQVFARNISGFNIPGNRGILRRVGGGRNAGDAPRFVVLFHDVTYEGKNDKDETVEFTVFYGIEGNINPTPATGIRATFQQTNIRDEDDDDEIHQFKPHIIITHYSYGDEQIVAGNPFTLDITYDNTSSDITLENVLVRISMPSAISITSGSNSFFVGTLSAGASLSHSIALQARPNADVGSHSIDITFEYQYRSRTGGTGSNNPNTRPPESGSDTEAIAIPITQIDRFVVDPITEMSEWVQAGDMFFVTVSFINEGKSSVYNVSARIRGLNMELMSPISRWEGEVRASGKGELDLEATSFESGNLMAEVVVSYEDDFMNQKEIVMPFSMFIQEPYRPDFGGGWNPGFPGGGSEEPSTGVTAQTVIFSIIGGLLIAAAIAMYTARRIIAKEREEMDEDF